MPGVVGVAALLTTRPQLRRRVVFARAEQARFGVTPIVEHPTERYHHRISVATAQNARPVRHILIERFDPHSEVVGVDAVGDVGGLRTARSLAKSAHQLSR